jgi:hypothetical protein
MKTVNQLSQVQIELSKSRYELIASWIKLRALLGLLDNQVLNEINMIFS